MVILYVLIPLSIILLGTIIWSFFWAVKNDQFEDLEQHSLSIFDDEIASVSQSKMGSPISSSEEYDRV